ncbi:hypothetical protein DLJ53_17975 [Acuticoccus sediminis]|uniref:Uncharacterized protein n=1 Tax=Acuticoccus sediminis TaxID=2184697 RepID=A0A8B2NUF7_9HYPH|nr:hypothetical protein [Acuticoccus sediminis]RAI01104.1 hypothetical protein DLJ53_17975 [Acuticoccus sediminis]
MSLVRAAIRIAAMEAIYNRTSARENVSDSDMGVIDQIEAGTQDKAPFIVVYTDDSTEDEVSLVFETAVLASVSGFDDDGNPVTENINPITDGQMERLIDTIEWQIRMALRDPGNPWANILESLSTKLDDDYRSLRASEAKTTRFAARQLTMKLRPLIEPTPSGEPTGAWANLIEALEASDSQLLNEHGAFFRRLLDPSAPVIGWQEIAMRYGLSAGAARTLGVAPEADGADTIDTVIGAEAGQSGEL